MPRTVLILGDGLVGIVAAQRLRRALPRSDRVVLIDRAAQHLFPPSLPWLLVGKRQAPQISRPLQRLSGDGIEFIRGEVTRILPHERGVEVDGRTLSGDALIIALGAEVNAAAVPGLEQAGHCLYTLEGASAGQAALRATSPLRGPEAVPRAPQLTINAKRVARAALLAILVAAIAVALVHRDALNGVALEMAWRHGSGTGLQPGSATP